MVSSQPSPIGPDFTLNMGAVEGNRKLVWGQQKRPSLISKVIVQVSCPGCNFSKEMSRVKKWCPDIAVMLSWAYYGFWCFGARGREEF